MEGDRGRRSLSESLRLRRLSTPTSWSSLARLQQRFSFSRFRRALFLLSLDERFERFLLFLRLFWPTLVCSDMLKYNYYYYSNRDTNYSKAEARYAGGRGRREGALLSTMMNRTGFEKYQKAETKYTGGRGRGEGRYSQLSIQQEHSTGSKYQNIVKMLLSTIMNSTYWLGLVQNTKSIGDIVKMLL